MSRGTRAARWTIADCVIFGGFAVNAVVIALILWFYVP
jgi:hypothetical protein